MTCGIYLLRFNNTDKVYIGLSKNIENRLYTHTSTWNRNTAAKKLQEAYIMYGKPTLEILEECLPEELPEKEIFYIKKFNSIDNGFNASLGGNTGPVGMEGVGNSNSIYSKEDLFCVLYYLTLPQFTIPEISSITGVSKRAIENIASLKSHTWLLEEYPDMYKKIIDLKNIGRDSVYHSTFRSSEIVSPSGEVHKVLNITEFAKTHGLSNSNLSEVLRGYRPTHKGWHLSTYIPPISEYPPIVSPEGIVHIVKFNGATKFAKEHGLDPSAIRHVMHGNAKSHKGWKLCNLSKTT